MSTTLVAPSEHAWITRLTDVELRLTWQRSVDVIRDHLGKMTSLQTETCCTWLDIIEAEARQRGVFLL
jgi:hypothetical protein